MGMLFLTIFQYTNLSSSFFNHNSFVSRMWKMMARIHGDWNISENPLIAISASICWWVWANKALAVYVSIIHLQCIISRTTKSLYYMNQIQNYEKSLKTFICLLKLKILTERSIILSSMHHVEHVFDEYM